MLSVIRHGLASVKSGVLSILKTASATTTLALPTGTISCTTCESSRTCDGQNEYCSNKSVGTTAPVNGSTSTPTTPAPSLTLSQIDDAVIDTIAATPIEWAQRLRNKYGISKPMEDE